MHRFDDEPFCMFRSASRLRAVGLLQAAVFLLSSLFSAAHAQAAPASGARPAMGHPRLILLYMTCTLNKSFLSPYNAAVTYTPHLERFSREGHVFTKHRTEAGSSGIAFASVFSGSQAIDHGIFNHPSKLFDSVELISETFARHGYEGHFWDSHSMASADLNYGQGIQPENIINRPLRGSDPRFLEILKRLRRDPDYRAFVVTAFTVTHQPYRDLRTKFCAKYPAECDIGDLPTAWIDRHLEIFSKHFRAFQADLTTTAEKYDLSGQDVAWLARLLTVLYRSNVEHLDRMFGAVIEDIRRASALDEAIIAFTADHGEAMYDPTDDFHWYHGGGLETEILDVPLIIRSPGQSTPPVRADFLTRSIDVFPTIAGLAGLELPDMQQAIGFDLSAFIHGEGPAPELRAFSHNGIAKLEFTQRLADELRLPKLDHFIGDGPNEPWVALREGDMVWKYRNVGGGEWRFQAFDLRDDPSERRNIYEPRGAKHRAMAEQLMHYKAQLVASYAQWEGRRGSPQNELSEDDLRRLRSLGYIQ